MEPSSLRRTQTLQQFSCIEPRLVLNDYLENLGTCFSDSIFPLFVQHFKGIENFIKLIENSSADDRKTVGVQLLKILCTYFQKEALHIRSLDIKPYEYRSYLIEILQTLFRVSGGEVFDKKTLLEVIHLVVMTYPTYHEALFSTLGSQLNVGESWDQDCFEFLHKRFVETPTPQEEHFEVESYYLYLFSNLYTAHREEFTVKYASYHLSKEPQTVSEYLDHIMIAAFRTRLPQSRKPPRPELAKALIKIFNSSQFINLNLDAAIYHLKNIHNFFVLPDCLTYASFAALLACANKEVIVQLEVITLDKAKKIKIYKPQVLSHFVSTRQLQHLFDAFVNPHLKWDRETFREANKSNLVKLFQRNIRVVDEVFVEKVTSNETFLFESLVVKTKAFCEAYGLNTKLSIDHLFCELFAGTCARLHKAVIVNRPLPYYCDPRQLVWKQIKDSLVNDKIVETIRHLFKQMQEIDPTVYERHKHRLVQKMGLLDKKKIRIGSDIYLITLNRTELSIVREKEKPKKNLG